MSNAERRDARCTTQLYNFSLVVCRHPNTGKYLLCQEFASQGFWLPGGAVDAGEGLVSAAKRETMEEAGMKVDIKGILAIEYHPCGRTRNDKFLVRMRVVFYAEPTEEYMHRYPKCIPDFESAGACWCSLQDMATLQLRGREPLEWGRHLEKGGDIYPLGVLREREC
jgi:8-oxo-dGTP pyrophosphatase MutT (NUDIX family)